MPSTETRPMPVFMTNDNAVAEVAHSIAPSLLRDINARCYGLLGHEKHHVEMFIPPEGFALNIAQQYRKQCEFTQLRLELFDETFPLEATIFEVVDNIVTGGRLCYKHIVVELIVTDVYPVRGNDYDHGQLPVVHIVLKK